MCEIDNADVATIQLELHFAWSAKVKKLLIECLGTPTLNIYMKEQLLAHIKSVALNTVHTKGHTLPFNAMKQEKGETIANFVGQLKSKAILCSFEVECTEHNPTVKLG